jgi:hypothetical protein
VIVPLKGFADTCNDECLMQSSGSPLIIMMTEAGAIWESLLTYDQVNLSFIPPVVPSRNYS